VEATGGGFKPKDNPNDIQNEIETLLNNDKMFGRRMMEKQLKVNLATKTVKSGNDRTQAYLNSARKSTATMPATHSVYGQSQSRLA
jgi:hypothetical protein